MPLKQKAGSGSSPLTDVTLRGKISWFGGPNDATSGPTTASGAPVTTPGIAVYNRATLGGYWRVTTPNGKTRIIQQTDIGPAPWTGRVIDFTSSALGLFGYSEANFPTNSVAHAVYLGKNKQAAVEKGGNAVEAAQTATSGGEVGASVGAGGGTMHDASLLGDAGNLLEVFKDLLTGNIGDLGGKVALASLSVVKDFAVGFADLIIAPAWHWDQRATAYYSGYVLDPRRVADGSEYQYAFAWTAVFWGVGYVLLFTEPGGGNLKPAPVHKSRLAHHVRRAQSVPARRSLVKPSQVKEKTPKKPKPKISTAYITQTGTMSTTRTRQVKVHGSNRRQPTESDLPIEREGVTQETPLQKRLRQRLNSQPNAADRARERALRNQRVHPSRAKAPRRRSGNKP